MDFEDRRYQPFTQNDDNPLACKKETPEYIINYRLVKNVKYLLSQKLRPHHRKRADAKVMT
jgi:hypothetical protein